MQRLVFYPFTVDSGGIMWYIISVYKRNIKHKTSNSKEF